MTYTKEQLTDKWFEELEEEVKKAYSDIIHNQLPALMNVGFQHDLYDPLIEISADKITREVYPLFLWLRGEIELPEYHGEIMLDVLSLVWLNPFIDRYEVDNIDWDKWAKKTKLGFLMKSVKFNEKPN